MSHMNQWKAIRSAETKLRGVESHKVEIMRPLQWTINTVCWFLSWWIRPGENQERKLLFEDIEKAAVKGVQGKLSSSRDESGRGIQHKYLLYCPEFLLTGKIFWNLEILWNQTKLKFVRFGRNFEVPAFNTTRGISQELCYLLLNGESKWAILLVNYAVFQHNHWSSCEWSYTTCEEVRSTAADRSCSVSTTLSNSSVSGAMLHFHT